MKDTIRELMQSGTTPDELRAVIDKYEAEMAETAALAREKEIEEARMVLMDALAKYYVATGILTEEEIKQVNWNVIMGSFKQMEQNLLKTVKRLKEVPKVIKVNMSEAPSERRNENFEDFLNEISKMFE